MNKIFDVIVIGMGPGGMSAGIYAVRNGLKTLVIGGMKGGQMVYAHKICNYMGLENISGLELSEKSFNQLKNLGADVVLDKVTKIEKLKDGFKVYANTMSYVGKSIILATGAKRRKLNVEGEGKFLGRGVSYCATCDAAFFKDRIVAVVGGGNSAVTAALLLSEYAKKVYLIHRRDKFRAERAWLNELNKIKKIKPILKDEIIEINGNIKVESVSLRSGKKLKVDGVFIEIGMDPNNELCHYLGVEIDKKGYVVVDKNQRTNIRGVYTVGDLTGGLKQIITAAAEGAVAAVSVYEGLMNEGKL